MLLINNAYGEIVSCFRPSAKDNIVQAYITQEKFLASNIFPDGNSGYKPYVFDVKHHQDYSSFQPIKVRFDFRPAFLTATKLIGYARLLTKKLESVSSDCQKQFDFIQVIFNFFIIVSVFFTVKFVFFSKKALL